MVYKLIENYINNMNINDVDVFAKNNGIILNNNELNIIYNIIKQDWKNIIYGDYSFSFNKLKENVDINTYKKAEELFFYFKNKYQRFL